GGAVARSGDVQLPGAGGYGRRARASGHGSVRPARLLWFRGFAGDPRSGGRAPFFWFGVLAGARRSGGRDEADRDSRRRPAAPAAPGRAGPPGRRPLLGPADRVPAGDAATAGAKGLRRLGSVEPAAAPQSPSRAGQRRQRLIP